MPNVKVRETKRTMVLLRIAVVVCGLALGVFWLCQEGRWNTLAGIFRRMNLGVFACVLCVFIAEQAAIALRWWLLLRAQSVFVRFWAAVRLYFLGWFYNNFMPGSVGGDLLRAWYVTKHTDKKFEAALSVFVDRAIGLLGTLAIAIFFYCLFLRGKGLAIGSWGGGSLLGTIVQHKWLALWTCLAAAVVFAILLLHSKGRKALSRAWSYIRVYIISMARKFRDAAVAYCNKPLAMLMAFGLTVFLQVLTITAFWFLGVNMGIRASIKYYYVFFTLTWVLGTVPVSIAGAVVVEGSLSYLFIKFADVQPEAALALALCQRIVWMLASLPGAAIHLMGAHLPKDFFVDCKAPMS